MMRTDDFYVLLRMEQEDDGNMVVQVPEGDWEMALIRLWVRPSRSPIKGLITCDLCEKVQVFGKFLNLLAMVSADTNYTKTSPIYRRVTVGSFERVKLNYFKIVAPNTSEGSWQVGRQMRYDIHCELHFRRRQHP